MGTRNPIRIRVGTSTDIKLYPVDFASMVYLIFLGIVTAGY